METGITFQELLKEFKEKITNPTRNFKFNRENDFRPGVRRFIKKCETYMSCKNITDHTIEFMIQQARKRLLLFENAKTLPKE